MIFPTILAKANLYLISFIHWLKPVAIQLKPIAIQLKLATIQLIEYHKRSLIINFSGSCLESKNVRRYIF